MIGNGIIQRKLALLDDQVLKIQQHFQGMSLERFSADWAQRSIAERSIQVAVELVIDIAERILALRNAGPAATASEAIEKLAGIGVLPSPQPYGKMDRLRNLVVHE